MSRTRTLAFTPSPSLIRESITHTSLADFDNTGLSQVFNRGARPAYLFKLRFDSLTKTEVDCLTGLHHFHQGGKSFFWDGINYGRVDNYVLVGEGDDARTEFFLPNRNIVSNSFTPRTIRAGASSVWVTNFSLNAVPGVLVFDTAPASGDDVQALYHNEYRCLFEPGGITVEEFTKGVYRVELTLRETLLG